jgi:dihydrofolate reductase
MRRAKLQMHISLDGFVEANTGGTSFKSDTDELKDFYIQNLENTDNILLGRKSAEEFISYWEVIAANPADRYHELAKLLTDIPKVIFSRTTITAEEKTKWNNSTVAEADFVAGVKNLKAKAGKDIMVYGGYTLVSSLIQHDLIDDYYLLTYPVALGNGKPIFDKVEKGFSLKLQGSRIFPGGPVLLHYTRRK